MGVMKSLWASVQGDPVFMRRIRTRGPNRGPEYPDGAWLSGARQARQAGDRNT